MLILTAGTCICPLLCVLLSCSKQKKKRKTNCLLQSWSRRPSLSGWWGIKSTRAWQFWIGSLGFHVGWLFPLVCIFVRRLVFATRDGTFLPILLQMQWSYWTFRWTTQWPKQLCWIDGSSVCHPGLAVQTSFILHHLCSFVPIRRWGVLQTKGRLACGFGRYTVN